MGDLSDDLRDMGYVPTGEESPVSDDGELWSNSHELICDDTGVVIDGNHHESPKNSDAIETNAGELIFRYSNSERVKLIGGYLGSYHWGYDDDEFIYDQ